VAAVTSYQELPIDALVIDRFQVRKQNVGERLDDLAKSIEKYGLLQPIVVYKSTSQPGKWEIVSGQRRYLAHKQILQRTTIMAGILEGSLSYEEGLALSASENVVRLDMTRKDLIDLCADLHKRYGSIKDVASETRLPYDIVRKYIRYDGLPEHLQKKVDEGAINVETAMKVQDSVSASGSYSPQAAEELLGALKKVDNTIHKKILKLSRDNPGVPIAKIVQKAEQPDNTLRLQLTLGEALATPLRQYAEEEGTDEKSAVESFIEDALKANGYLSAD
jgi:ParB family chromosome partitioning protein